MSEVERFPFENWYKNHKIWGLVLIGVGIAILIIIVISSAFYNSKSQISDNSSSTSNIFYCKVFQDMALEDLKAPATAKFQKCKDADYEINDTIIKITTYVDAENSFGALIRTKIYGVLIKENNEWKLDYFGYE